MKNIFITSVVLSSLLLIGCGDSKEVELVKAYVPADFSDKVNLSTALDNRFDCTSPSWSSKSDSEGNTIVTYSCTLNSDLEKSVSSNYAIYNEFMTKSLLSRNEGYYKTHTDSLALANKKYMATQTEKNVKDNMIPYVTVLESYEWGNDVLTMGVDSVRQVLSGKSDGVQERCYDNPEGTPECAKEIEDAKAYNLFVASVKELAKHKKSPEWEAKRLLSEIINNERTTETKLAREAAVIDKLETVTMPGTLDKINKYKDALANPVKGSQVSNIKESITWKVDRFGNIQLLSGNLYFKTPLVDKGYVDSEADPYMLLGWGYSTKPMDKLSEEYAVNLYDYVK